MNATIDLDAELITLKGQINIGIATSSEAGLVVPVLQDVGSKGLTQISREIAELADAVRNQNIRPEQLKGGTFTISNFGSYGTWLGTPIIKPPEVAILGIGRVQDRVVAVAGQAVVQPTLPLAVSSDHRLIDGHVMGAFVNDLQELIENPVLIFGVDN
jgi:pyruvate dehydrogenase E2 component (dihydrolipoamide acetyltransferase)